MSSTESVPAIARAVPPSRQALWLGRVLSALFVLFMLFDGICKLFPLPIVMQTMTQQLGFPDSVVLARGLGVLILGCTILHVYPRTAILGAVLLTGLLGGAIASQLRVESPLFSHILFGAYLGTFMWVGLYLRDPRMRNLI
jgi:hypothetical protein